MKTLNRRGDEITKENFKLLYDMLKAELKETIAAKGDFTSTESSLTSISGLYSSRIILCIRLNMAVTVRLNSPKAVTPNTKDTTLASSYGVRMSIRTVCDWGMPLATYSSQFLGITKLQAFLFEFHQDQADITERLMARGKLFEYYHGCHYKAYKGAVIGMTQCSLPRCMLTAESSLIVTPNRNQHHSLRPLSRAPQHVEDYNSDSVEYCDATRTTDIKEIEWSNNASESLVLPEDQKELIILFAESQILYKETFDNFVSGEGKGIIMLLSGSPGVGKPLTVVLVAEHMKVLYMMGASNLGVRSHEAEESLDRIMEMVAKWNAVPLLRIRRPRSEDSDDLERNKLVSIFLRTLEYYGVIDFILNH